MWTQVFPNFTRIYFVVTFKTSTNGNIVVSLSLSLYNNSNSHLNIPSTFAPW